MASPVLGMPVSQPPADGITRVRWSRGGRLLVTSWDETARIYDRQGASQAVLRVTAPLLDGCWQDDATAFVGALDGAVSRLDISTGQATQVGSHMDGVKCTEWLEHQGLLVTAGWDGAMCCWDPRAPSCSGPVARSELPGRAYGLAATPSHVIVATSGRHVCIYSTDRLDAPCQPIRESSLRFQTRCVAAAPGTSMYVLGSVEGRVAVEVLDPSPRAQAAKYAFKCHRQTEQGVDVAYPVHAVAHHPLHGTFATGGGDGTVSVWDGAHKKRLTQIQGYPTSVSSLAFSPCGGLLAVAASYAYEAGEGGGGRPRPPDSLYLRPVADAETRPKARKTAA